MRLHKVLKPIKEMLSYHEALRRFGFASEDIYVFYRAQSSLEALVGIVLQAQGKRFVAACGRTRLDEQAFLDRWNRITVAFNGGKITEEDMKECWETSYVVRNWDHFIMRLMDLGFTIPYIESRLARSSHPQARN